MIQLFAVYQPLLVVTHANLSQLVSNSLTDSDKVIVIGLCSRGAKYSVLTLLGREGKRLSREKGRQNPRVERREGVSIHYPPKQSYLLLKMKCLS